MPTLNAAMTAGIDELLAELRALDIRVWLDAGQIRCSAPKGALTPALRETMRLRRHELLDVLQRMAPASAPPMRVRPGDGREGAPLSPLQERLWFFHQLEPDSATYNMTAILTLNGPLDVAALERSVSAVARRHEILRTTFAQRDGEPRQIVQPPAPVALPVIDLTDRATADRDAAAEAAWRQEAERPFDLERQHPLRVQLVRLDAGAHHLIVTLHHIASDGTSIGVFMQELVEQYRACLTGTAPVLPDLAVQYADYAHGEREWLASADGKRALEYWTGQFPGELPVLNLPTDHVRPPVQTYRGGVKHALVPPDVAARLRSLGRQHDCTLFMTLLAAFNALLYRSTGDDRIVIGAPVSGRDRAETASLIGMFVNTLALGIDVSGDPSFAQLLARVRATCLQAFAHQNLPFATLLEALRPERDLSRTPLFQVMFNMFSAEGAEVAHVGGLTIQAPPLDRLIAAADAQAKFDLTLYARDSAAGLGLVIVYNADLFGDARMDAFLRHFLAMVDAVSRAPQTPIGDIALDGAAPAPGRHAVHAMRPASFEPMSAAVVTRSIGARFREVAQRHADRPAVHARERLPWTYGDLLGASERLASAVNRAVLGHTVRVALLCDHDAPMLAAILGVLEQGSAYVPLDPSFPQERLAGLIDDASVTAILADRQYAELATALAAGCLPIVFSDAEAPAVGRPAPARPSADSAAYILYTSGSTGRPKGVVQTHAGVLHHARTYANSLELTCEDRVLLVASYTFDAAVMDIFGALLSGATLYLANVQTHGLDVLAATLAEHDVTIYHSTPTVYRALAPMLRRAQCASVRCVVLGGEEVRGRDVEQFTSLMPAGAVFVNGLGPTESTTALQYFIDGRTTHGGLTVPAGYAVDSTEIRLLDDDGRVAAVTGEIAIVSPYVAAGYWNRPELTAQVFHAVEGRPGVRMYRTGDLGRRRPDGAIEFLGRRDQQVKVRGVRVELGEIEACLETCPGVRMAAATTSETPAGERLLVAFVVGAEGASVAEAELKSYLASRLPGYMMPAAIVCCPSLPLTRTGKIDRRALPAIPAAVRAGMDSVAPRNATEELVAEIWCGVLGRDRIGVHDNFFALGGHSLNATQVVARLRSVMGMELPLRALFTAPTIEGLAKIIGERQHDSREESVPPLARRPLATPAPLSYSQDRMWFLQQLIPNGTAYNMMASARLEGRFDRDAFVASLEAVAARHDSLRTTFPVPAGEPVQLVSPSLPLTIIDQDLRHVPAAGRLDEARRLATEYAARPFDLERGPLWWTLIVRLADDQHAIIFGFHHIIGDLWSFGVFSAELAACYNARLGGRDAGLPALAVQYSDYAVWQREWLEAGRLQQQLGYWKPKLHGLQPLELPTDRPRPPVQTSNGRHAVVELPEEIVARVRALSLREGATPFMTFLAGFNVLLSRYSGQHDVAVGVPIANRTQAAVEGLIGTFVNTLVHRNDLSGNPSFREAIRRVREVALEAFAHQDVPFERLVRELGVNRDASRSPVFQVLFNMANTPMRLPEFSGLRLEVFDFDRRAAQFDLTLVVYMAERCSLIVSYNTDLFDASTIERLLGHYVTFLDAATRDPERAIGNLPIMPAAERWSLLEDLNQTVAQYPVEPVTSLIAARAAETPNAAAIEQGNVRVTYADLEARANRLARWLSRTVAPGSRVGVCLDRSPNMVVALLAVMKAGCAYIPIDPAYPAQRVKFMLDDGSAAAVVTESRLKRKLPHTGALMVDLDADARAIAAESPAAIDTPPAMEALAYVLYTSGSTGNPKGVQIPHRALVNFLESMRRTPGFSPGEVLLAVTTISFDIAGLELYLPLACGGTIALASRDVAADGQRLREMLVRRQPDVMQATPATWRGLVDAGWCPGETPRLRVFCGGEALPRDLADNLLARAGEVWNLYGPTETTIWSTVHRVTPGIDAVPIGTPIANTRVYVLDALGEPTPTGVPGELFIGGDGVAHGYLNRPELSAERFVADRFAASNGARMYRTGDRARLRPDGRLEHLGRLDHQVKLRGYRIELGEIEAALGALPAVGHAVVDVRADRLVAYVVFAASEELTASEIRASLRDTLPDYMIPSLIVALDALPLTPNGKVDRRALPDPLRATARATAEYVAPSTPTEIAIAEVWRTMLGVERVSATDNFFELGGHSLLSIRAVHEIQQRTGWRPDPRLLFFETLGRIASARVEGAR